MELKGLADQLNSACEAHFGVSQFSGIPLRDELHQANSLEPEFEAIRCAEGELKKSTEVKKVPLLWNISTSSEENRLENRKIENREALIKSTLKKVFEREISCELKEAESGIRPEWNDGLFKNSTLFFFEEPKFENGSRIWICNCGNASLEYKEYKIKPCTSGGCLKISLKPEIGEALLKIPPVNCADFWKNPEEACKELLDLWELWKAFELAPGISKQKYTNVVFDGTPGDKDLIAYHTEDVFQEVLNSVLSSAAAEASSVEDSSASLKGEGGPINRNSHRIGNPVYSRSTGPASRYTNPKE
eukprot:GHVP01020637.1.p1 GENE.GHVP01020637.1~~GHVP01020637.1.p1  ORF type:complete len:303 (+),score=52.74 GHVP01020637.1:22-930(+)